MRQFRHHPKRIIAVAILAGLTGGCAVGPDYHKPAAPDVDKYTSEQLPEQTATADIAGGEAQHFVAGKDIPGDWWTLFHSEPLNALIDQALKANPDVRAAQASLRVAQENLLAQRGYYYPSVDASAMSSRQMVADPLASPLNSGQYLFNLHTAQLDIGYNLDIFGGVRRQVETMGALVDAQRFQLEAAYLTLTSNLVAAVVQEASLRTQLTATQDIVTSGTEILDLMRSQHQLGAISSADVLGQETLVAQAQATLPQLQKQLAQQRNLILALTGRLPNEELAENIELDQLQLPGDLPVTLPSKLVEQRPDIQLAAAQLHAATAQVGVATADMLPKITLGAEIGSVTTDPAKLFSSGTGFWSIFAGVTQPIFHGGTLLHQKHAAEAGMDVAAAQYQSTVITAFQNVSDSLRALQYDAEILNAQLAAKQAAEQRLEIMRNSIRLGVANSLALLNAQQAYQQAVITLAQARANRYADTVALFQALGGGWWNRNDVSGNSTDAGAATAKK